VLTRFDPSPVLRFRVTPEIARNNTDPGLRHTFALGANAGWLLLSFIFVLAMPVIGVPVKTLISDPTGNVVLTVCLGSMLCVAGAANVLWRMYWVCAAGAPAGA
jgi:hypothetical protein